MLTQNAGDSISIVVTTASTRLNKKISHAGSDMQWLARLDLSQEEDPGLNR